METSNLNSAITNTELLRGSFADICGGIRDCGLSGVRKTAGGCESRQASCTCATRKRSFLDSSSSTDCEDWSPCEGRTRRSLCPNKRFVVEDTRPRIRARREPRPKCIHVRCRGNDGCALSNSAMDLRRTSLRYIAELFQPWFWKARKSREADGDGTNAPTIPGPYAFLIVLLIVTILALVIYYLVSGNRDNFENWHHKFSKYVTPGSSTKVLNFENRADCDPGVTKTVGRSNEWRKCDDNSPSSGFPASADDAADSITNLEDYLKEKAERIVGKWN